MTSGQPSFPVCWFRHREVPAADCADLRAFGKPRLVKQFAKRWRFVATLAEQAERLVEVDIDRYFGCCGAFLIFRPCDDDRVPALRQNKQCFFEPSVERRQVSQIRAVLTISV
jgi:hypothetical protein